MINRCATVTIGLIVSQVIACYSHMITRTQHVYVKRWKWVLHREVGKLEMGLMRKRSPLVENSTLVAGDRLDVIHYVRWTA